MRFRTIIAIIVLAAVAFVGVLVWRLPWSSDRIRTAAIKALSERLDRDIELASLTVRVFPRPHAEGTGLSIKRRGQDSYPPLISVKSFSVDGDLVGLYRKHVARVELVGLDIQIPPGDHDDKEHENKGAGKRQPDAKTIGNAGPNEPEHKASDSQEPDNVPASNADTHGSNNDFVVDTLVTTDARLVIIPRSDDKSPKVWNIHRLHMNNIGISQAMPYQATLTNAVPPGEIETSGHFGPWQRDDPGTTPLDGTFSFEKADLSVFKGISGILSAHGSFGGQLRRIDIHGETLTPDFTVAVGGHPVPLKATYHSFVDGTNGDTILDRIDASFLNTAIVAKGGVVELPGKGGREVSLNVTIDRGRLEDVLKLAVKTPRPPMQGGLKLSTRFVLPPGERDVVDKLRLKGQFSIAAGKFTSDEVQQKINELSRRGRGNQAAESPQQVASDFAGQFALGGGVLSLPNVTFKVPGAGVQLAGQYALRAETLSFQGDLLMDATVSQAAGGGVKSMVLKAFDPIFQQNGRTVIPIKISGTRQMPAFGVDAGRIFKK